MTQLVVAGVLARAGRLLASRRTTPAALAGRWEFPGGKVEAGETPAQALTRELAEELGIRVAVADEIPSPQGNWPISDTLSMRVFWVHSEDLPTPGAAHDAVRWVARDELSATDWVPADQPVARLLHDLPWP